MRLLFDENLSRTLCHSLRDVFPGSQQVCLVGLEQASDADIWRYAKASGFVVVTKDSDFHQMSFLFGAPPKVVWLRAGNCTTAKIEMALREHADAVHALLADERASILVLDVL